MDSKPRPGLALSIIAAIGFGALAVWVAVTGQFLWAAGLAALAVAWSVFAVRQSGKRGHKR